MKTKYTRLAGIGFVSLAVMMISGSVGLVILRDRISFSKQNEWAIGIYYGTSPLMVTQTQSVTNPILTKNDITDVNAEFVADPFMIRHDTAWFMFFEVLNRNSGHGDIGLATSSNGSEWEYKGIVLDEEYHLSYPYVFRIDSTYYLIPESAAAHALKLYRAELFPTAWQYETTLIEGEYGDHGLVKVDNTWWLFACSEPYSHSTLRLFFADSLKGPWQEHPLSPIVKNNPNKARPGGNVFLYGDRMIRLAQDCAPTYGKELNGFEIISLSRTDYREREIRENPILQAGQYTWTRHGMHHLNPHRLDDGTWIACVDGYKRRVSISFEY